MMRFDKTLLLFLALLPVPLHAAPTSDIRQSSYADFAAGELDSLALSNLGVIRPGPVLTKVAELEADVIFDLVEAKDGTLYAATGNSGKVFRIPAGGEPELFFKSRELLVRALALGPDGALYVGSSPNGRVYRVAEGERPEIYFEPGEVYIWDMLFDEDGALYVSTGADACIYKVPPGFGPGQEAEKWFTSDRTHLSVMALDGQGNLLAGSGPNAYLYRITGKDEGEVLFNAGTDEITVILPEEDGSVVFATMHRITPGSSDNGATPMDLPALLERLESANRASASSGGGNSNANNSSGSGGSRNEGSGGTGPRAAPSFLFRLGADGFVEPLWSPGSKNILSLLRQADGAFLIGTDDKARLFTVAGRTDWELTGTVASGGAVAALLKGHDGQTLLAASNPAIIYRLDAESATGAVFTSKVADASSMARWGRLRAVGSLPGEAPDVSWETRTGNSPEPDDTWADWSPPEEGVIANPPGRYFQYRATFTESEARLREVRAFYVWRNAAPVVTRINIIPVGLQIITVALPNKPPLNLAQITGSRDLPSDISDAPPIRTQVRFTGDQGYLSFGWSAFDPNGDTLRFSVALRQEGSDDWATLVADLEDTLYSLNTRGLEDGYYRVRVTASDAPSNAPAAALGGSLISDLFLIDNTPPKVKLVSREIGAKGATLVFGAEDAHSVIRSAAYVLNGKPEVQAFPEDGIFDSTRETFRLEWDDLPGGSHTVVFQATDESGNTGTAQAVFVIGEAD